MKFNNEKERKQFILDNTKLTYFCAKDVYYTNTFLEKEDILQEAMIGLIKAVDNFDESKCIAFSTFAYRIIKNHLYSKIRKTFDYYNYSDNSCNGSFLKYDDVTSKEGNNVDINSIISTQDDIYLIENKIDIDNLLNNQIKNKSSLDYLKLFSQGYTTREIGKKYNVSHQCVSAKLCKVKNKIYDYLGSKEKL